MDPQLSVLLIYVCILTADTLLQVQASTCEIGAERNGNKEFKSVLCNPDPLECTRVILGGVNTLPPNYPNSLVEFDDFDAVRKHIANAQDKQDSSSTSVSLNNDASISTSVSKSTDSSISTIIPTSSGASSSTSYLTSTDDSTSPNILTSTDTLTTKMTDSSTRTTISTSYDASSSTSYLTTSTDDSTSDSILTSTNTLTTNITDSSTSTTTSKITDAPSSTRSLTSTEYPTKDIISTSTETLTLKMIDSSRSTSISTSADSSFSTRALSSTEDSTSYAISTSTDSLTTILTPTSSSAEINECDSNPCQNNGSCTDQVNVYSCVCTNDFVGDNCDISVAGCFTGWPVQIREGPDSSGWTAVSPDQQFQCNGQVVDWRYLAKTSHAFRAIVWRATGESVTQFQIVGINDIPAGAVDTPVTYTVPENERITVQAGDMIGWSGGPGVISWNTEGDLWVRMKGGNLHASLDVNQVIDYVQQSQWFGETYHVAREYSIKARVVGSSICNPNPCRNDGTCYVIWSILSYECSCIDGFTGSHCDTEINECKSNPCPHNGTCSDDVNAYSCYLEIRCNFTGPELAELMTISTRVIRGQEWTWNDEIYNLPAAREAVVVKDLTASTSPGWISIQWEDLDGTTHTNAYRMGNDGAYDLQLAGNYTKCQLN